MRSKLAELIPTPATKSAPVILVAVSEEKINQASGAAHFAFDTQDYAAAVENILLGAVAMGCAALSRSAFRKKRPVRASSFIYNFR